MSDFWAKMSLDLLNCYPNNSFKTYTLEMSKNFIATKLKMLFCLTYLN